MKKLRSFAIAKSSLSAALILYIRMPKKRAHPWAVY